MTDIIETIVSYSLGAFALGYAISWLFYVFRKLVQQAS
jgi:hypothetical protein